MNARNHRGVAYTIVRLDAEHWDWKISPPRSLHGLRSVSGTTHGSICDAVETIKARIDAQIDYRFMQMDGPHGLLTDSKSRHEPRSR